MDLVARVQPLRVRHVPIELEIHKPKAQWVEPRLLVDVEYRAKTGKSNLLRHPSYRGLRLDLME
jgi:ATP-dependent DNA ligase